VGPFTTAPATAGYQSLAYQAAATFAFDNNGFGGAIFVPADKRASNSPTQTHDVFVHVYPGPSPSELQLWTPASSKGLAFATVGLLAEDYDGGSLCFFAAGKEISDLPTSNGFDYFGYADGLTQLGGSNQRMQGSEFSMALDFGTKTGTVKLDLVGREDPFGDLSEGSSTSLGTLTGMVTLSGNTLTGTLSGANGVSGTVRGQFFNQLAQGVGIVFELKDPAGATAIGAAAADIRGI
jgi:hypothetical protein